MHPVITNVLITHSLVLTFKIAQFNYSVRKPVVERQCMHLRVAVTRVFLLSSCSPPRQGLGHLVHHAGHARLSSAQSSVVATTTACRRTTVLCRLLRTTNIVSTCSNKEKIKFATVIPEFHKDSQLFSTECWFCVQQFTYSLSLFYSLLCNKSLLLISISDLTALYFFT